MFVASAKGYFRSAGHSLCIDLVGLALSSALEVFFFVMAIYKISIEGRLTVNVF